MDRRGVSTAQHSYRIAQQDLETSNRGVAQPGRVLRSGRRSRRFESSHPDQFKEQGRHCLISPGASPTLARCFEGCNQLQAGRPADNNPGLQQRCPPHSLSLRRPSMNSYIAMPAPISATTIKGILCSLITGAARKATTATRPIRPANVLNFITSSLSSWVT